MQIEMHNYLFQDSEMLWQAALGLLVALTVSRTVYCVVDNLMHHAFVRRQYDYERANPIQYEGRDYNA